MCAHVRAHTEAQSWLFFRLVLHNVSSSRWPQQAASGAASLFFLRGVSKDWFSNTRGSWAAISVKRKGWKGEQGSSSLSIEVGIDLWQLSIKVCRSRTTRWESGFPSPAKDEWPGEREGQGFRTRLPEKNHKNTVSRFCVLQPCSSQLNPFPGNCMQESWKR